MLNFFLWVSKDIKSLEYNESSLASLYVIESNDGVQWYWLILFLTLPCLLLVGFFVCNLKIVCKFVKEWAIK